MSNFSYPRTDFVHIYQPNRTHGRGSLGSDCSAPPMVEDHGSDFSTEDDHYYYIALGEFLDSFRHIQIPGEMKAEEYLAQTKPTVGTPESGRDGETAMMQENMLMPPARPPSSESEKRLVSRPLNRVSPEPHRPRTPKRPPRVSYSLFPSTDSDKRRPAAPPLSLLKRAPGAEPSTQVSRRTATDAKGNPGSHDITNQPSPSRAATPHPPLGDSIAASSSDSIPLLLRDATSSPEPSPPISSGEGSSRSGSPVSPRYPWLRTGRRTPSINNLRDDSLPKGSGRSSPALARLSMKYGRTQPQARDPQCQTQATANPILARPLPPLPSAKEERPPSPPQVSVFETDSDDEADDGGTKRFARRLMHGLVHHHHHHHHHDDTSHGGRNRNSGFADHKRSASDDGPTASSGKGSGGRHGISRAVHAARHRRAGTSGAVSMDLPREDYHHYGQQQQQQEEVATEEGAEEGNSSRSAGEVFWGRLFSTRRRRV